MPLVTIADLNGPPEEVQECVAIAKELSLLYDYLANTDEDGKTRAPGIHASELYPCIRRAVYSLLAVERKPRVSKFWRQRFKVGHAIHGMVQADFHELSRRSLLENAWRQAERVAKAHDYIIEFEDEVKVAPELQALAEYYNIHSSCDGVFCFYHRTTGELKLRVGLEIKTEAPDGYEKLRAPKDEHVRQTHLYMACLDVPLMWFFYMNKGNQNNTASTSPYLIAFKTEIWLEIEGRCKEAIAFAKDNALPDRAEGIWCEFCPWSYTCQPDNSKKMQRPPDPKKTRLRLNK